MEHLVNIKGKNIHKFTNKMHPVRFQLNSASKLTHIHNKVSNHNIIASTGHQPR